MNIDKTDIEWLIMMIVMIWPYIKKPPNKKAPKKRKRGRRRKR